MPESIKVGENIASARRNERDKERLRIEKDDIRWTKITSIVAIVISIISLFVALYK